jgi:hypothetical protein
MPHLKRVCIHWTAGSYTTNNTAHYHCEVGKEGELYFGKDPSKNIPPLKRGQYVAHCGGGNSWTIGVSMRGMAGYKSPAQVGKYPLTTKQCEATWEQVAKYCLENKITVTPDTVYTHYEFGLKNPNSPSAGKIDIVHLPHQPHLKPHEIGDYIRGKVKWYMSRLGRG